jgi:hypothetical protein
MELPSCTTSDQSTKEPEGKNVNIAATTVIELEYYFMFSGQTMTITIVDRLYPELWVI